MWADHYPIGSMWHVGMPTMSAIPKSLAAELEIRLRTRVRLIEPGETTGSFSMIRAARSHQLAGSYARSHHGGRSAWIPWIQRLAPMSKATYDPNWTLMVVEPGTTTTGIPMSSSLSGGPISWIVNQRSKPGHVRLSTPGSRRPRSDGASTTSSWTGMSHSQAPAGPGRVADRDVMADVVAHRWRYAFVNRPAGIPALIDEKNRMAACGDWCLGDKASHAIRSGHAAAEGILQAIQ